MLLGIGLLCGGGTLAVTHVRPAAAEISTSSGRSNGGGGAPASAFTAAVFMGLGDGTINTVATARLGCLAEDVGILPRQTAFQYFQCVNVLMTGVSFAYMRTWPLVPVGGSLVQIWILAVLAAISAASFTLLAKPVLVTVVGERSVSTNKQHLLQAREE